MKKIGFIILIFSYLQLYPQQDYLFDFKNDADFFYHEGRIFTAIKPLEKIRLDSAKIRLHEQQLKLFVKQKTLDYLLNKPFLQIKGEDYFIEIKPSIYFEGSRISGENPLLFVNTRGLEIDGALGKQFAFSTAVYENQARFPGYLDTLFVSRQTGNGFPATLPGFGIAKIRENGILDFPSARGHIIYKPSKFFTFKLGHDTFFVGEGYRSLLLGDDIPPYPYFEVVARFWNVRYTVMWSMLQDIRPEVTVNGFYYKKYMALHYIDWAITARWNLGLFEGVIWDPGDGRGFDPNFINPVIFFKTVEFQSGTKGGNTLLGLNLSYRPLSNMMLYGQFLLDEMTVSKFFGQPGYWGNKFGTQLGIKAFYIKGLHRFFTRLEWNRVRPYTYSHHRVTINYGHNNYALAHPWGANLSEVLFRIKWDYKRWFSTFGFVYGLQGVDFPSEPKTYGADIYRDYEERVSSDNVKILQGNLLKRIYVNFEAGYVLNPSWNWKFYTGIAKIDHQIDQPFGIYQNRNQIWWRIGMRANVPFYKRDW